MKHPSLVYLVLCLWCWAPLAQLKAIPLSVFLGGSPPSAPAASYLIKQNFEGTGYDTGDGSNGGTWVIATGTPNPDYTTVVLLGSQSLLTNTFDVAARARTEFTSQDTVHCYFLFRRVGGGNPGGDRTLFSMSAAGSESIQAFVAVTSTGAFKIQSTAASTTSSTTSIDTTYHVWCGYTKGTGANAQAYVTFSTDGTKPADGNAAYAKITTGSGSSQVGRIYLGYTSTTAASSFVFDSVLVDDVEIGSNP